MRIEKDLGEGLQVHGQEVKAPEALYSRVRQSFDQHRQRTAQRRKRVSKRVVAATLAGLLLVPTVAGATGFLGDRVYGSFQELKREIAGVTHEMYTRFSMKLSGAQSELGDEQFERFIALLQENAQVVYEYGNEQGHVNIDQLPHDVRQQYKSVLVQLQPLFDRLNKNLNTQEVLTAEEFDRYIEAQLTSETVFALTGAEDAQEREEKAKLLPAEFQQRYQAAQALISEVDDRVRLPDEHEQKLIGTLGQQGFEDYQKFLREWNAFSEPLREVNSHSINVDQLSPDLRDQYKKYVAQQRHFMERIWQMKQSQEVLSAAEYDQYLEAFLSIETAIAQYGKPAMKSEGFDPNHMPADLRERYLQAEQVIDTLQAKLKN